MARILLLEDEKRWRERLTKLLVQHDYDVEAVGNPDKAASLLAKSRFDALVVDIQMSQWDSEDKRGLDLLDKVAPADLPAAVVVSGKAAKPDVRRAFRRLKVIDVIEKDPFVRTEFLDALREAVAKTRQDRAKS